MLLNVNQFFVRFVSELAMKFVSEIAKQWNCVCCENLSFKSRVFLVLWNCKTMKWQHGVMAFCKINCSSTNMILYILLLMSNAPKTKYKLLSAILPFHDY